MRLRLVLILIGYYCSLTFFILGFRAWYCYVSCLVRCYLKAWCLYASVLVLFVTGCFIVIWIFVFRLGSLEMTAHVIISTRETSSRWWDSTLCMCLCWLFLPLDIAGRMSLLLPGAVDCFCSSTSLSQHRQVKQTCLVRCYLARNHFPFSSPATNRVCQSRKQKHPYQQATAYNIFDVQMSKKITQRYSITVRAHLTNRSPSPISRGKSRVGHRLLAFNILAFWFVDFSSATDVVLPDNYGIYSLVCVYARHLSHVFLGTNTLMFKRIHTAFKWTCRSRAAND